MKNNERKNKGMLSIFFLLTLSLLPEIALAAPWDGTADKVLEIFTGGLTRTLAIIAIIVSGILAMFGRWSWVINIGIGIVLIFGGAAIVDYIIAAAALNVNQPVAYS